MGDMFWDFLGGGSVAFVRSFFPSRWVSVCEGTLAGSMRRSVSFSFQVAF